MPHNARVDALRAQSTCPLEAVVDVPDMPSGSVGFGEHGHARAPTAMSIAYGSVCQFLRYASTGRARQWESSSGPYGFSQPSPSAASALLFSTHMLLFSANASAQPPEPLRSRPTREQALYVHANRSPTYTRIGARHMYGSANPLHRARDIRACLLCVTAQHASSQPLE